MPRPLLGCTFISNLHQLLRSSFLHPSFLVRHASHSHDYYHDYLRLSLQSSNPMLKSIGERNLVIDKKKRKKKIQEKKRDPNRRSPFSSSSKFTRIARESRSLRDADPLEGVGVAREILVTA